MKYDTAYFYLTPEGKQLVDKLAAGHPGDIYGKENFKANLQQAFGEYEYLVCVMATGIVVRILAPLIVHKTSDPGVVVFDQKGQHAISLLSGHLGGANDLAGELAAIVDADPVITTATDVAGELSFDTFAKKYGMAIENIGTLKHISGALLEGKPVLVVTDYHFSDLEEPVKAGKMEVCSVADFKKMQDELYGRLASKSDVIAKLEGEVSREKTAGHISEEDANHYKMLYSPTVVIDEKLSEVIFSKQILYLRPRTIYAGIGCKRNMEQEPIEEALRTVLKEEGISPLALKSISTIPLKANEPGIIVTAERMNVPLTIIPTEEIESLDIKELGIAQSEFVAQQTGVLSVSTASSYIASGKGQILRDKVKFKGITIALSQGKI